MWLIIVGWFLIHTSCFWFVSPPSSSALDDGVIVGKHWLSHNFHLCYLLSCEELLTVLWPAFVNTDSAALRCPWRPVLMVHFDTWPCCEASECFFGVFFIFLFVVLFSLSRFCTECDFSATFVSELMMSHCGWIKSSINQIYTLFLC